MDCLWLRCDILELGIEIALVTILQNRIDEDTANSNRKIS